MTFAGIALAALLSVTNVPGYYACYEAAVTGSVEVQRRILAMPSNECVRGNSTYANTERFLLGPDNPHWMELRGPGYAEKLAAWRAASDKAVATAAARPHPRLFADAAAFARLRERAASDALLRPAAGRVVADAEVYLSAKPVERTMSGYRLLGPARKALTRLATLSMAYRLTGDARFVRRAEREIESVAAFSDWNPAHFLDVAELSVGVSLAYDWLYDALAPECRDLAARALRDKALGAAPPHAPWTRLRNNWVQVGSAGMVAAAAAIADLEPELCAVHLADVLEALPEAEGVVAPDGAFPEGPGYWHYGFTFNAFALDIMKSAFGTDFGLSLLPGFRETASFPALMTGPSGEFFAFSDGHTGRPQIPALWWFAVRFGDPSLVDGAEMRLFRRACGLRVADTEDERNVPRDFPIGLLWVDAYLRMDGGGAPAPGADKPSAVVLGGEMPVAVLRGSASDADAVYVATKGGCPAYNHGHADEGTFVLDLLGERWAYDLGAENYTAIERAVGASALWSPEPDSFRWKLFRLGAQGHNTLMIGGEGQYSKGVATVSRTDGGGVEVDLSELYPMAKDGVVRRFGLVRGGCEIEDVVRGVPPGTTVRWAMVTDAEVTLADGPFALAELKKNGKTITVLLGADSPGGRLSVREARPDNAYEKQNEGFRQIVFEFEARNGSATCSALFSPGGVVLDKRPPKEILETEGKEERK